MLEGFGGWVVLLDGEADDLDEAEGKFWCRMCGLTWGATTPNSHSLNHPRKLVIEDESTQRPEQFYSCFIFNIHLFHQVRLVKDSRNQLD